MVLIIMVLVSVGFFTLLERKCLSYIQYRSGPNKVGYLGLFQPFADGLSLFLSKYLFPLNSNYMIFCVSLFCLIHSLFIWVLFPFVFNSVGFIYGLLFFYAVQGWVFILL